MSGATVESFIEYWQGEGEVYARRGDYDWMAAQTGGERILEIGCGLGFGTAALIARGCQVLAIDSLPICLERTQQRVNHPGLTVLAADLTALSGEDEARIQAFAPETVVCWLMGAPADATGAVAGDGGKAVTAYRDRMQRCVAELATRLPSVTGLHFVDRTAFPWQAKDIGRDTLVRYHNAKTLDGLPFVADRQHALFRKLDEKSVELAGMRQMHPALKGVVPVLGSLFIERKK